MGLRYVSNDGPNTIYIGGKLIAPGEGREVDERLLPRDQSMPTAELPADPGPSLDDLVGELRAKSVKDIAAELPGLTQEALDRLAELEHGDPIPRKTLLAELGNEQIRRADAALTSDPV